MDLFFVFKLNFHCFINFALILSTHPINFNSHFIEPTFIIIIKFKSLFLTLLILFFSLIIPSTFFNIFLISLYILKQISFYVLYNVHLNIF